MLASLPKEIITSVLNQLQEGVMIIDVSDRLSTCPNILYVNSSCEKLIGFSYSEVVNTPLANFKDTAVLKNILAQIEEHFKKPYSSDKSKIDTFGSSSYWCLYPLKNKSNQVTHFIVMQCKYSENKTQLHLQKLELLTKVQNEIATGSLNLDEQRQKVADIALKITGADSAAVEEVEKNEMVYRAVAGKSTACPGVRLPIDKSISGLAYKNSISMLCNDVDKDERVELKDKAKQIGFISGILVPLIHQRKSFGVLKVFANETNRFGNEELHLLKLVSGVLASSLYKALAYQQEINRRSMLLDNLPAFIAYIDKNQRYQEVNAAYEKLFDKDAAKIRGSKVQDMLTKEGYDRIRPYIEAALKGEKVTYENDIPVSGNLLRTFHGDYIPYFAPQGSIDGFYAIIRDITDAKSANQDYLTKLANRRYIENQGKFLISNASRYNEPLSIIMADLDHFKNVNDCYGHIAGDKVLKELAKLINETTRQADLKGRWGGEEFLILLPKNPLQKTLQLAERLRKKVQNYKFPHGDTVTISLGISEYQEEDTINSLLSKADRALYQAKQSGRNRIETV